MHRLLKFPFSTSKLVSNSNFSTSCPQIWSGKSDASFHKSSNVGGIATWLINTQTNTIDIHLQGTNDVRDAKLCEIQGHRLLSKKSSVFLKAMTPGKIILETNCQDIVDYKENKGFMAKKKGGAITHGIVCDEAFDFVSKLTAIGWVEKTIQTKINDTLLDMLSKLQRKCFEGFNHGLLEVELLVWKRMHDTLSVILPCSRSLGKMDFATVCKIGGRYANIEVSKAQAISGFVCKEFNFDIDLSIGRDGQHFLFVCSWESVYLSNEQKMDIFIDILSPIIKREEAKKRIYSSLHSCNGFGVVLDQEAAAKVAQDDRIHFFMSDCFMDVAGNDYGADKVQDGIITPRRVLKVTM
ncbi:hypothetical protein ACHQM5_025378 [Ranunculus cassubicifolius]